ncbi:MAG TPA: site-2 protease family protein [Kiritimatiellia bacterium]|nr:site-2 protease family protein [Kiritimatiellia bacterium]
MFGGFQIARPYGIPLKLHWTVFIFLPYMATFFAKKDLVPSPWWGALAVIGILISVAVHELGHSLVARGRGFPVHSIVLTPVGGVAFLSRSPRRSNDEISIAIAGPLVSIAVAVLLWFGAYGIWELGMPALASTIQVIGAVNLGLAIFNMLPCFPMDGGRVFRAWQAKRVGRLEATRRAVKLGKYFAIFFAIYGLFNNLFLVVIAFVVWQAAAAEYRMVQMQERPAFNPFAGFIDPLSIFRGVPPQQPRPPEVIDVEVGPPPYQK